MDKKQELIDLWRISFDDSEAFINLFFDRVYKDENALTIVKDGKIISALHMLPYTMTFYGKEISVTYIYGASTLPSERGQGLMRQLIHEAFEEMKHRDVALAIIVPADPWLFDYYRDLGYTEAFDYTEEVYTRPEVPVYAPTVTVVPPEVPSNAALYNFFDRKMRERSCCLLHTFDDFITILRDIQLSGGQVLTALDIKDNPIGIAFLYPPEKELPLEEQHVYIKELLYDDDSIKQLLLQEATLQHNVKTAVYRFPFAGPGTFPMGMARVIDRKRLIHLWLRTHDNAILNSEELENMETQPLTRLVLGYPSREAYMSLMLD